MIDIHCHILYGVDEGAVTLKQSINMLKQAHENGVKKIIATPNYAMGCVNPSLEDIQKQIQFLRLEASKIDKNLEIYTGTELYFSEDSLEYLRKGYITTLAETRYVLVKYPEEITFKELKKGVHQLLIQGFYPVLSQVNRYECLLEEYEKIEELIRLGVCIEVDKDALVISGTLLQRISNGTLLKFVNKNKSNKRMEVQKVHFINNLIMNQQIHFIGSNTTSYGYENFSMKKAYDYISYLYGQETAEVLFVRNGERLLKNENIAFL